MAGSNRKPRRKKQDDDGQVYSPNNYRILRRHELILRHASVFFEANGATKFESQDLLNEALDTYTLFLEKRRGMPLPDYLSPNKGKNPDKPKDEEPPTTDK